ncbi:Hsp70 family protein [Neobacillus sp. SAB-20_R2A]|uniref:Hsp70 family protein n=1 Tax=Neobacillus sp. SAB-20_R2A TaxID=3120519 RepID=UPI003C6E9811
MKYSLGIDLGTTYSVMAVVDESGKPVVLPNKEGQNTTPSVVYFGGQEPVVGEEAKDYQSMGSENVAAFFKRSMGEKYYRQEFNGKTYDTIELSSLVLKKLKSDAELQLGQVITDAVITVPAYFNNSQREATIKAGERAGLHVLRIINEPTAAAISYGMRDGQSKNVMVYDLGGGTFDVTVAAIKEESIDVLATDGDHNLGGKDWDDCLTMHVSERFREDYGLDPMDDDEAFNSILVSCEKAKKTLSARGATTVRVACGGKSGTYELTQALFEDLTSHLIERTWKLSEHALEQAGLKWQDLAEIILVGGSTRMPMIAKYIEKSTGKKPKTGHNVDEVVALGAAIQASIEAAHKEKKRPVFSLGPARKIHDVMSHSLGMVAKNTDATRFINSKIIAKNKPIPATEKKPFKIQTSPSGGNALEIYILQGESERPLDCTILGKYVVSNITHVPKGQAVIEVSYSYDQNGVVKVMAHERSTGGQLPITIEELTDDLSWTDAAPPASEVVYQQMSVLIAIDLSGSMSGRPLREAQKAAVRFVEDMNLEHTSVGLIGFADDSLVTLDLSQSDKDLAREIDRFRTLFDRGKVGYGNWGEPFTDANKLLSGIEGPRFLIVLTDGVWDRPKESIDAAHRCHKAGIEVIAVGFGEANRHFLKEIETADENALNTDITQLVSSFSKIAQVLTESGLSYKKQQKLQFFN